MDHTYNDVLPSANLKFDVTPDLVARFAASRTMTRADYSALGGFTNLSPPGTVGGTGTGSGGNPDLKPIRSTNLDAGLEWYFGKRSLLSGGLFYMDLDNYVSFGSETKEYLTFSSQFPNGAMVPYLLTVPVNAKGRVQGAEFAYQQAINDNFGIRGELHVRGRQADFARHQRRRSARRHVEEHVQRQRLLREPGFSARITYTYRSTRSSAAWTAIRPSRRTRSRTWRPRWSTR